MAINKVVMNTSNGEQILIDLTADNISTDKVFEGVQFHASDGSTKAGTFTLATEMSEQDALIEQIQIALQGKASGGGGSSEPDPRDQYQRVEYIESATAETYPYIITDFKADNSSGMEVIASFPKMHDRIPMGSRENSDATRFYCVYPLSTSSVYYGFNTGVTVSCALSVNKVYRLQTNFLNSRLVNVYEESGTRKASAAINATLTQQSAPVAIFGYNSASSGSVSSKREYKLYGARCSRGHEVVREYIPCYRKSDGVVGVYEKFTGQFLTCQEGVAFTHGAEIDW